jgi:N-methylhydantoinase B/oxoprolinase/acetone carboxylase alpha subunit
MRPPPEVANDVREKWIGAEAAERVYGVRLGADGEADIEASEILRAEMAGDPR